MHVSCLSESRTQSQCMPLSVLIEGTRHALARKTLTYIEIAKARKKAALS